MATPVSVSVLQPVRADTVLGEVPVLFSVPPTLSPCVLVLRLRVVDLVELLLQLPQLFLWSRAKVIGQVYLREEAMLMLACVT